MKAMQSLYSYFLMKASVCDLIEEELVAKYALDPALHDFLDRELFEAKQNLIKTCFRNRFVDESSQTMVALDEEDLQEVENSYLKYENLITAEVKSIRKNNTWNIRLLVDDLFVPSSKQPSVIYCRLTDL